MVDQDFFVLPGFLLESDGNGGHQPAQHDYSGGLLNGHHRLEAGQILASRGVRFLFIGGQEQVGYLHEKIPGHGHFSVMHPEKFPQNTSGNVAQYVEMVGEVRRRTIVPNLYYGFRWVESVPEIQCLPAEAVLAEHYGWGTAELSSIFGTGPIAGHLIELTMASVARIRKGENGHLTVEEIQSFDAIISRLPTSTGTGPARDRVPAELRELFTGPYLKRLLDDLIGVADMRAGTYHSFRPRPE